MAKWQKFHVGDRVWYISKSYPYIGTVTMVTPMGTKKGGYDYAVEASNGSLKFHTDGTCIFADGDELLSVLQERVNYLKQALEMEALENELFSPKQQ